MAALLADPRYAEWQAAEKRYAACRDALRAERNMRTITDLLFAARRLAAARHAWEA